MSNLATTDDENSQVATGVTTPSIATAGATFAAVVAVPINATRTTRAAEQRNIRTRYNGALRSTSDESNNVVNSNGNNELMPYHNANNNIGNDSNASRILIDNSGHNAVSSNRNSNSNNNNNNNALNFRALNGFHNLNGFHGNGITTPTSITVSNSNTLQEQQQQTTTSVTATTSTTESTTTSNGDLVVCHEALANLRVFRVTNNNVVNSNSNSNRNSTDNGNNSQSENTEHQSTVTGTYRGRVRHRLRRDIHYMRRSLKSMNKILVKTVNTLRRLKMLILQQVQLSRALHLGSQLTM